MSFADGALNSEQWMSVVADAVARIDSGGLEKVVLARDLVATADEPIDVRWPLRRLTEATRCAGPSTSTGCSARRPRCWSAASAAWSPHGCSPAPSGAPATTARPRPGRHPGPVVKDLEEHEYAVRSVADALEPHCSSMNVPEAPFVLHLPNVMHLATDVAGVVHDAATVSSLELAEALHPSAAVGGTPDAGRDRA